MSLAQLNGRSTQSASAASLNTVIHQINRRFGELALAKATDLDLNPTAFSTGFPPLDDTLGGGFPRGRILEVFGDTMSGKTTLALKCIAQLQQAGGGAAFIDVEHALTPNYAEHLGVNPDELLVCQPTQGEAAMEITETLVKSREIDLVVIDSVTALLSEAELNYALGENIQGCLGNLMSKGLRRIVSALTPQGCSVLFLNQLRMRSHLAGPQAAPSGGRALPCYSSIRIELINDRPQTSRAQDCIQARVVKNKITGHRKTVKLTLSKQNK